MDDPLASQIARLLTSGLTGIPLLKALRADFPAAGRNDFFMGVVLAISMYESGLMIAESELEMERVKTLSAHDRLMAEIHKIDSPASPRPSA